MKVRPACAGTADRYREGLAIHSEPSGGGVVNRIDYYTPPRGAISGVPLKSEVHSDPARSETPCAHRSTLNGRREIPWLTMVVVRTQWWDARQHALGQIRQACLPCRHRQAAKRDWKTRFTALWHHVYRVDCLRKAFLSLKRVQQG